MQLPADKSWSVVLAFVVTYAIALGVLLIGRNSGGPVTIQKSPEVPAGPRRPNPQGLTAPGSRARPSGPVQQDSD